MTYKKLQCRGGMFFLLQKKVINCIFHRDEPYKYVRHFSFGITNLSLIFESKNGTISHYLKISNRQKETERWYLMKLPLHEILQLAM